MATSLKKIVSISVWSAILCTLLLFIVPLQAQAAISAKSDTTLHGSNTTGSTVTLTFPTGANAPKQNDVVIFFGGHGSAGGAAGPSTAGYTRIASTTAATAPNFGAWYKVMGASPDTTVAGSGIGSTDGTAYAAYLLTGVDTSVFDATSVTAGPTTSTNPDAASITTVTSGAWVLDLAGNNTQDNSPGTVSTFTNLTISDNANSSAADLSIAGAATTSSPVGADNPAAWSTWASGNWFAITIALKPGIAPTVSTQAASPIGATTATLNGNIDVTGGINASNRGFAWGTNNLLSGGDTATTTEIGDFSTGAFTNSSLTFTANTTYYSRAYATSSAGVGVGSIQSFKTLPAQPGTPTYTSVAATSLTTNWTDTTGATTYNLERCITSTVTCTRTTLIAGTSQAVSSLVGNTSYDFAVQGVNATGNSVWSATSTKLTLPDTPGTPTFDSITETTLTASWVGSVGSSTSYTLTRCPNAGGACTVVTNIGTTTYPDSSLSSNVSYDYSVRGVNATGNGLISATSTVATIDTTPPSPDPATFSSAPAAASVSSVSMTATTETDAATPPVNYLFGSYACVSNGGTGGADSGWQSGTSYTNPGLQVNKCYGYKVQARDAQSTPNKTASSSESDIYTLANAPGTPTLGSPTATTLTLTNAENSNPAANPTTKFAASITATSPTDSSWLNKYTDASGNPTATETWLSDAQLDNLVLNGLTGGTDYTIKVAARNENLIKTASSTGGTGTTLASAPGTPTFGTVTATTTDVTWTASTGATSYKLEVCSSSSSCSLFTGITSNATTTYNLAGNTSYDYAARAVNGAGDSTFSATSTKLTLPSIPGTPTFSSITETTMTILWDPPTGGATSYKLERCTGSGCTDFVQIYSNTTASFADSSLSSATTYRYRVRATNGTGDGLYSIAAEQATTAATTGTVRIIRLKGGVRLNGGIRLR